MLVRRVFIDLQHYLYVGKKSFYRFKNYLYAGKKSFVDLQHYWYAGKTSLKTPKGYSESVYRRRTDNTMVKRKSQTTIYKTYI